MDIANFLNNIHDESYKTFCKDDHSFQSNKIRMEIRIVTNYNTCFYSRAFVLSIEIDGFIDKAGNVAIETKERT